MPVFLLNACRHETKQVKCGMLTISNTATISLQNYLPSRYAKFSIAGNNMVADTFCITPSAISFTGFDALLKSILADTFSDKEKALALWRMMCEWTEHSKTQTESKLPHNPLCLLNSFETGLCDDRNAALVHLCHLVGLQARLYHLTGHLVAEVFYDSAWHMLDADWRVYFNDSRHEVASVDYISRHPACINATYYNGSFATAINALGNAYLRWVYSTTNNNRINPWHLDMPINYHCALTLGKGDSMVFEIEKLDKYSRWLQVFFLRTLTPYTRKGILYRQSSAANIVKQSETEFIIAEKLPYAVTKTEVRLAEQSGTVYYSPDSLHWYFKGEVQHGQGVLLFETHDEENNAGVFCYWLKIVTGKSAKKPPVVAVKNSLLFSRKLFLNPEKSFKIVNLQKNALNLKLGITALK